jgi:hypothetical protein
MHIHPADRDIVKWAIDKGLMFSYERNNGLQGMHLKLHIGMLTAFFRNGKLAHLAGAADGRHLDQFMWELTELFGLCAENGGYLDQDTVTLLDSLGICNQVSRTVQTRHAD